MAYAALCLDDSVVALSSAQQLVAMKDCTPAQKYVARCYCAEALCLLSRPQEALEYLQPPAGEGPQAGNTQRLPPLWRRSWAAGTRAAQRRRSSEFRTGTLRHDGGDGARVAE